MQDEDEEEEELEEEDDSEEALMNLRTFKIHCRRVSNDSREF